MEPSDKSPEMTDFLDEFSTKLFGRPRAESIKDDTCVGCGNPAIMFRNALSSKEYTISGLCQDCQDDIFGVD